MGDISIECILKSKLSNAFAYLNLFGVLVTSMELLMTQKQFILVLPSIYTFAIPVVFLVTNVEVSAGRSGSAANRMPVVSQQGGQGAVAPSLPFARYGLGVVIG